MIKPERAAGAAVVRDGVELSNVVASQDDVHKPFGGTVPELAARNHVLHVIPVIDRALEKAGITLDDVNAVAATRGPGLVGSLLVGLCAAKAIARQRRLPFVGVNHIEGHLLSGELDEPVERPFLGVVVSGGHTSLYLAREDGSFGLLGQTRDDAAGEAFDKAAKLLGLGYPGGREIERVAKESSRNNVLIVAAPPLEEMHKLAPPKFYEDCQCGVIESGVALMDVKAKIMMLDDERIICFDRCTITQPAEPGAPGTARDDA